MLCELGISYLSYIFPVCVPANQAYSEKGVYSKMKELGPMGSKFFHFRVHAFSKGRQQFDRVTFLENVS